MGKGFVLDTHALIWWLYDPSKLSNKVAKTLRATDRQIFASAASAYEVSYKFRRGQLDIAAALAVGFLAEIAVPNFTPLSITPAHAQRAGLLTIDHRDPFDRMLIAQALVEDLVLVSNEEIFDASGVQRLW